MIIKLIGVIFLIAALTPLQAFSEDQNDWDSNLAPLLAPVISMISATNGHCGCMAILAASASLQT